MEDAESTASGTVMGATMLLASSLDVRKYALGLSRLRRGRYECDCAYRKLHLALQSLAKDHVIMR